MPATQSNTCLAAYKGRNKSRPQRIAGDKPKLVPSALDIDENQICSAIEKLINADTIAVLLRGAFKNSSLLKNGDNP
jgi:hypothetical protein